MMLGGLVLSRGAVWTRRLVLAIACLAVAFANAGIPSLTVQQGDETTTVPIADFSIEVRIDTSPGG